MKAAEVLLLLAIFGVIMTALKYILSPKNAIKINTWYSILDKEKHDFKVLLDREKKFFPIFTLIAIVGYILTRVTNNIWGNVFVALLFLSMVFYTFYTRPPKIKT